MSPASCNPLSGRRATMNEVINAASQSAGAGAEKSTGFFQVDLEQMKAICAQGLGPDALYAYVVLAGGVDADFKLPYRASAHGVPSIMAKTGMSARQGQKALKLLEDAGFIQTTTVSLAWQEGGAVLPRFVKGLIEPSDGTKVAISQRLFGVSSASKRASSTRGLGTLAELFEHAGVVEGISFKQAQADALMTFCSLHAEQDFQGCAGIDPCVAHGRFDAIDAEEDGSGTDHVMKVRGAAGWLFVTMRKPDRLTVDQQFLKETFGPVSGWSDAPTPQYRFDNALRLLRECGLVYEAQVLWDSDPVSASTQGGASPLFTLHVSNSWDREREATLQRDVHEAMLKTHTFSGEEVFGDSRGLEARWAHSGRHRFMVPDWQLNKVTLLTQLRARWWPGSKRTLGELDADKTRVDDWRDQLKTVVNLSSRSCL